jgi:hypothetical protein
LAAGLGIRGRSGAGAGAGGGFVASPGRPKLPAQQVSIARGALKTNLKEIVPLTARHRLYVVHESVF